MGWVRIMEVCPFWSIGDKVELCDKKCPMIKDDNECIFRVYNPESELIEEEFINKELVN